MGVPRFFATSRTPTAFISSEELIFMAGAMRRIEKDTFGDIEVRDDRLWGAQTQRYVTPPPRPGPNRSCFSDWPSNCLLSFNFVIYY